MSQMSHAQNAELRFANERIFAMLRILFKGQATYGTLSSVVLLCMACLLCMHAQQAADFLGASTIRAVMLSCTLY